MEKVMMVANVISILLILLIISILSNKQSFKLFKSEENLKRNLLYRLPIIMFIINVILNITTTSLFNNWLINLMLILIPFISYILNKYLNNK